MVEAPEYAVSLPDIAYEHPIRPSPWDIADAYAREFPNAPRLPWNWMDLLRQRDPLFLLTYPMFDRDL